MNDPLELYKPRVYEEGPYIVFDDAVPRDRQFWVERDVIGGPKLFLSEIGPIFFGQSESWMRNLRNLNPKAKEAIPDLTQGKRKRLYGLHHVEQIAHNLIELGIISPMSGRYALLIVKHIAVQHALVGLDEL